MSGVSGGDFLSEVEKLAVGCLDDVGLGDHRHLLAASSLGVVKGRLNDAFGAGRGDDPEVYGQVVGDIDALASHGVQVFGVLPEEDPVDFLLGNAHRADVGEQVEHLAHSDVGAFDVGPAVALFRGVCWAFEGYVAFGDLLGNVVRDCLEALCAVLDGEALKDPELHLARVDLLLKEMLEHTLGFSADVGSDAVTAEDADDDGANLGKVLPWLGPLEPVDSFQLLDEHLAEVVLGGLDCIVIYHAFAFLPCVSFLRPCALRGWKRAGPAFRCRGPP